MPGMNLTIDVQIGGSPVSQYRFNSFHINQRLFHPTEFTYIFGYDRADFTKTALTNVDKWIGKEISAIVKDSSSFFQNKKYIGKIKNISIDENYFTIIAISEDEKLESGKKHRTFLQMKSLDIIKTVLGDSGITANTFSDSKSEFEYFLQYNESNYDLIKRLARYEGYVCFHDGEKFNLLKDDWAATEMELTDGDITDASVNFNIEPIKYQGSTYNYFKKQPDSGLSNPSESPNSQVKKIIPKIKDIYPDEGINEVFNHTTLQNKIQDTMTVLAENKKSKLAYVKGRTQNIFISVGKSIKNGSSVLTTDFWSVISIDAKFDNNGYYADFIAVPSKSIVEPPINDSNLNKLIMQPALVTNNEDPENMGRVKVKYIWEKNSTIESAWARIAFTAAGPKYGTHYVPRIDDEVLISFMYGDPSMPIILGSLYNGQDKPDFVTNNGTEEVLVVKTPQETTIRIIDTPGSEEIIISERSDTNIIRLILNPPSMFIESKGGDITVQSKNITFNIDEDFKINCKNLTIEASEVIKETSGKNFETSVGEDHKLGVTGNSKESIMKNKEITATQNISLAATSKAEIKATSQVSINGTMVESKATATNVIQGAIVQIN